MKMAKGKEISSKTTQFAKGGSGHMVGQQGVKPSRPGAISVSSSGKSSFGIKGGNGHMFGKQTASPAKVQ
jgi:hypothetical protein